MQPVKLFQAVHYSEVTAIEKLNEEIFATAAHDGIINIWNTRMNKLLTSISIDNVSALKFISKRGLLVCAHSGGLSSFSVKDNFE